MPSTIPFFPPSLADETLASRVARYHIIAGNRSPATTLNQLFQQIQAGLDQIIPSKIAVLAAGLPGDSQVNLQSILDQNTLLPLFSPFIGRNTLNGGVQDGRPDNLITRLPRRVVGKHGEAYLCLQCVLEDEQSLGMGYWHRAHQAPGVSTCWKHHTQLIDSCPQCSLPFQRRHTLLTAPWNNCPQCSHDITHSQPEKLTSDFEHKYAVFIHDLIALHIAPIPADILAQVYRARIRARGFTRGSMPNMIEFTESLISTFGPDFISQIDPAYSTGRTHTWIRFTTFDGSMDIPIMRHILICMHLFENATQFLQAVQETLPAARPSASKKKQNQVFVDFGQIRTDHRNRIRREIKLDSQIKLEKLWKRAYTATSWLFEHDNAWLKLAVDPAKEKWTDKQKTASIPEQRQMDKHFADLVEACARKLVTSKGKPQRVTYTKLFVCLPKAEGALRAQKEAYPTLFDQLSQCAESAWSFSCRKILWSIGELVHLELTLTISNVSKYSGVSLYVVRKILNACRWDVDVLAARPIDIQTELRKAGIGQTWQGPDDSNVKESGGRAYISQTSRGSNRQVDLLPNLKNL
ncbi:MAG: TnsD family transposase [Burkholderiaceae bacterium]|nr:TnsD family transposase [Burkholderiaceae bacterium]